MEGTLSVSAGIPCFFDCCPARSGLHCDSVRAFQTYGRSLCACICGSVNSYPSARLACSAPGWRSKVRRARARAGASIVPDAGPAAARSHPQQRGAVPVEVQQLRVLEETLEIPLGRAEALAPPVLQEHAPGAAASPPTRRFFCWGGRSCPPRSANESNVHWSHVGRPCAASGLCPRGGARPASHRRGGASACRAPHGRCAASRPRFDTCCFPDPREVNISQRLNLQARLCDTHMHDLYALPHRGPTKQVLERLHWRHDCKLGALPGGIVAKDIKTYSRIRLPSGDQPFSHPIRRTSAGC